LLLYPNKVLTLGLEQLDDHHFSLEDCFEHLKVQLANHPSLFNNSEGHQTQIEGSSRLHQGIQYAETLQQNRSLVNSLRAGGHILYARHGEATVGRDLANLHLNYCYTQRNLSEFGRIQAITFGITLQQLGIPIQYPVLASPFCRTRETAELAFGRENVQVDPFWVKVYDLSGNLRGGEQRRTIDSINTALESKPLPGYNKVIIAHSFPGNNGLGQIPNMGTVVLKPLGEGNGYEIISRLSLNTLTDLV